MLAFYLEFAGASELHGGLRATTRLLVCCSRWSGNAFTDRQPRTGMNRHQPCASRRRLWQLLSRPTAGAAPLSMEEALGFDSPVGRPSGTSSPALRKVRILLAHARTRPLPMHRPCADSVCTFHCSRLISHDDLRVRRSPATLMMRACTDAFGVVRHTVCGGRCTL